MTRRITYLTMAAAMIVIVAHRGEGSQATQDGQTPAPPVAAAGLADLASMTFSCPQAGLNAAAREAALAPSQGTYQFSYFRLVNDAHHAAYEVHFKSNFYSEPVLRYCVALYCQQGWDPRNAQPTVTLMTDEHRPPGKGGHGAECGAPPATTKPGRSKR